MKIRNWN